MTRRVLYDETFEAVSVPVAPLVQLAIERATQVAHDAIVSELAPFGLGPIDIVIPVFEQVVYEDEVPIYAALVNDRSGLADWERGILCDLHPLTEETR